MKKLFKLFVPTFLGLFLFANAASAHVSVVPKTSTTGAWETYTVKVPVEKNVATTKFTLKTPEGVEIESYQPVPGWNYSADKDASGKVISITFEATGEGILPGQFQQFTFTAKNPDKAGQIAWDAFQYYKDGTIVEWTKAEGGDTPHSITDIVAGAAADDHHHDAAPAKTEEPKKVADTSAKPSTVPMVLSIVSVVLSLIALIMVFRKK